MTIGSPCGNIPKAYFEFGAVTTVDINTEKIFRDVAFSWSRRFDLPGSGVVDIVMDPAAVPAGKTIVVLPVTFTGFGAGPINVDLYFGTNYDPDGTEWIGSNRDNRSLVMPGTTVRLNPTINSAGVKTPFEFMIPSNGVAANASVGGQTKGDLIFIARDDGAYMFRLTNTSGTAARCTFAMTIFEAEA